MGAIVHLVNELATWTIPYQPLVGDAMFDKRQEKFRVTGREWGCDGTLHVDVVRIAEREEEEDAEVPCQGDDS